MALFGMFNYAKPGPGVDKDAPKKKRFFYFFELYFRKFWKWVELNLLFCLCCLPVVTIGPAIAGMTYILRNFAQERPVFMVSDFWDAFKSNFKQGFCIWFLDVLVTGIASVAFAWYFINSGMSWAMAIPLGLCILAEILLMFMRFYSYLMVVTVDLPVKNQFYHPIFCTADYRADGVVFPDYHPADAVCRLYDAGLYRRLQLLPLSGQVYYRAA